jgi:2,3-diketo-5-methylthio-1-phosphopentane phosphatase
LLGLWPGLGERILVWLMGTRSKSGDKTTVAPKPVVCCDFDGTMTQLDVTDLILTQFAHPSWREVEQEWTCGSIGSRECLERQMALVEASAAELNALIDAVPVDPHLSGFLRFVDQQRLPFYVLSEGFDYIIRRVLKRAGINGCLRNGTHLFASALRVEGRRWLTSFPHAALPCEHGCATCKAEIVRRVGGGRSPIVFIGDGLSDRFAVGEADLVFAKRQLLAYCREEGIACWPFETFAEIEAPLRQLIDSGPRLTQQRIVESQKLKVKT